jgi:hypothetical protein
MVKVTQADQDAWSNWMKGDFDVIEALALHREAASADLQAKLDERDALLKQCFAALGTLEIGALGYANDEAGSWPIRDELMSNIDALLTKEDAGDE